LFVSPHPADGSVGEVPLVSSAGLSSGLALGDLARDVATRVEAAVLGDAGDVEQAVDPLVASVVKSVPDLEPVAFAHAVALALGHRIIE
jgi:hypothetical protein